MSSETFALSAFNSFLAIEASSWQDVSFYLAENNHFKIGDKPSQSRCYFGSLPL